MNLERTILDALNLAGSNRMIRETVLLNDIRDAHGPSLGDLRLALRALEDKHQVIIVTGEDFKRVKITDAGRARLLE